MVLSPLDYALEVQRDEEHFPWTCDNCRDKDGYLARGDFTSHWMYEDRFYREGKAPLTTSIQQEIDGEWTTVQKNVLVNGKEQTNKAVEYLPTRCERCNRHYCKFKNTKKQIYKLTEYCFQRRNQFAKMITIGLPVEWDDPRSKFTQLQELKKKWKKLRDWLIEHNLITGGIYVAECTTKVSFDGTWPYFDRDENNWVSQKIGEPDFSGLVKYHCHIHAVVDMPTYRGKQLAEFSGLGPKFGLGRISVTYHRPGATHWEIKHAQAKYLAKYVSKDIDCGRQATFGKFIGFRMPDPQRAWKDSTLC